MFVAYFANGLQGIPRTIVLDKKTDGYLLQWPVEEIDNLRLTKHEFNDVVVKPGSVLPLDVGPATQVCICFGANLITALFVL